MKHIPADNHITKLSRYGGQRAGDKLLLCSVTIHNRVDERGVVTHNDL